MALTYIKPKPLKSGDCIGVFASSGAFDKTRLSDGIKTLENLGFKVKYQSIFFDGLDYLAGEDHERLFSISTLIEDPEITAIIAVRGGYGSMRILDSIDYEKVRNNRKLMIGFSDITALHLAWQSKANLCSLHGPHMVTIADMPESAINYMCGLMSGESGNNSIFPDGIECWNEGRAEGRLLPANLTLLSNMLGTRYIPDITDKILMLEDVAEPLYKIDRKLTHLELAGVFDKVCGLCAGQFTFNTANDEYHNKIKDLFTDIAQRYKLPLIGKCPFGHEHDNYAIPVGTMAKMDAASQTLEITESLVE